MFSEGVLSSPRGPADVDQPHPVTRGACTDLRGRMVPVDFAGALSSVIVGIFSPGTEVSSCTQEQAPKMFHKYLSQSNSYYLKNIVLKQHIFLVEDTEKQIRENKIHP